MHTEFWLEYMRGEKPLGRCRWDDNIRIDAAAMEEMRNAYRILVGKPEGKRPLGSRKT
jgi:hypothetical protein